MGSTNVISWQDAANLLRDTERQYNIHLSVEMHVATGVRNDSAITITLTAYSRTVKGKGKVQAAAVGYFPNRRWRTATGAVVGLTYDIVEKLENKLSEERAKRQLPLALE